MKKLLLAGLLLFASLLLLGCININIPAFPECNQASDCIGSSRFHGMCVGWWGCRSGKCVWICDESSNGEPVPTASPTAVPAICSDPAKINTCSYPETWILIPDGSGRGDCVPGEEGFGCPMTFSPLCDPNSPEAQECLSVGGKIVHGTWHGCPTCFCECPLPTVYPSLIGGDRDEHGCLPAAGYTWCESKQKCLRTWEESCPL